MFVALVEAMVDFGADGLERLSNNLAALSARVFGPQGSSQPRDGHFSRALRECLKEIGMAGDHLSRIFPARQTAQFFVPRCGFNTGDPDRRR